MESIHNNHAPHLYALLSACSVPKEKPLAAPSSAVNSNPSTAPSSPASKAKSRFSFKKKEVKDATPAPDAVQPASPAAAYPVFTPQGSVTSSITTSPTKRHILINLGRRVIWYEDERERSNEVLPNPNARAIVTSMDLNKTTCDSSHLEAVVGFSTGEFAFRDLLANKSIWFNKNGVQTDAAVTVVKWVPGSENLFVVGFDDGTLIVMDKARTQFAEHKVTKDGNLLVSRARSDDSNPVLQWYLSEYNLPINDLAFRDPEVFGVVGRDGVLRVLDLKQEKLLFALASYFGALLCVSWSHDGKYIITGGQDDLVSIWSYDDQDIVARGDGHMSWVTSAVFVFSESGRYRIVSVSQDAKLLMWDFAPTGVSVPRATSAVISMSSEQKSTLKRSKKRTKKGVDRPSGQEGTVIPARPRSEVPDVIALEDALLTCAQNGEVRFWRRPNGPIGVVAHI